MSFIVLTALIASMGAGRFIPSCSLLRSWKCGHISIILLWVLSLRPHCWSPIHCQWSTSSQHLLPVHVDTKARLCVYCTKTPTSRLHLSHLWCCKSGSLCSFPSAGYLLLQRSPLNVFSVQGWAGPAWPLLPGHTWPGFQTGLCLRILNSPAICFAHCCWCSFIEADSFVGQNRAAGACWVITRWNQSINKETRALINRLIFYARAVAICHYWLFCQLIVWWSEQLFGL